VTFNLEKRNEKEGTGRQTRIFNATGRTGKRRDRRRLSGDLTTLKQGTWGGSKGEVINGGKTQPATRSARGLLAKGRGSCLITI